MVDIKPNNRCTKLNIYGSIKQKKKKKLDTKILYHQNCCLRPFAFQSTKGTLLPPIICINFPSVKQTTIIKQQV